MSLPRFNSQSLAQGANLEELRLCLTEITSTHSTARLLVDEAFAALEVVEERWSRDYVDFGPVTAYHVGRLSGAIRILESMRLLKQNTSQLLDVHAMRLLPV